jgi:hypothetical protein
MMFDRLLSVQFEDAREGRDQEQQTWCDRDKGHEDTEKMLLRRIADIMVAQKTGFPGRDQEHEQTPMPTDGCSVWL